MLETREGYLEELLNRLRTGGPPSAGSVASAVAPPLPPRSTAATPPTDPGNPAFWHQLRAELKEIAPAVESAASRHIAPPEPEPIPAAAPLARSPLATEVWLPFEPQSLEQAGLQTAEIDAIILRLLLNRSSASGRQIAAQIRLSFKIVQDLLHALRNDQLIAYKGAAAAGDYQYQLTPPGRDQARRLYEHSTYFGSAPVTLEQYVAAISAQSLHHSRPGPDDLRRAFADLLIQPDMLHRLAQAVHHGRGLFLHGAPGNGKTSIAQRLTRAFGESLWIPRAIGVDGDIIRLFDPCVHEELPLPASDRTTLGPQVDDRWVRIRRPTIMVGGELTMDRLEVTRNTTTGTCEAPLQLKSNCGTLVIDDFGRQRMSTADLLNRWIVPLDKGFDFLNLPSGKTIQVPFDQMIAFSTNLEPRDLMDEAFLRRIPYKIDVRDPSEADFRELLRREAAALQVKHDDAVADELIEKHYRAANRPFRACHARDLLRQVKTYCEVHGQPVEMSAATFDIAVANYFATM